VIARDIGESSSIMIAGDLVIVGDVRELPVTGDVEELPIAGDIEKSP